MHTVADPARCENRNVGAETRDEDLNADGMHGAMLTGCECAWCVLWPSRAWIQQVDRRKREASTPAGMSHASMIEDSAARAGHCAEARGEGVVYCTDECSHINPAPK